MRDRREALTPVEERRLYDAAAPGLEKLIIGVLLDTGLRVRELARLRVDDIDFESKVVIVVDGKGKKRRVVDLPPRAYALMADFYTADRPTLGRVVRTIEYIVQRVARRARIHRKCSPHILRHTFATGLLRDGVQLSAIQAMLGHENLTSTQIYLHMAPEEALRDVRAKRSPR